MVKKQVKKQRERQKVHPPTNKRNNNQTRKKRRARNKRKAPALPTYASKTFVSKPSFPTHTSVKSGCNKNVPANLVKRRSKSSPPSIKISHKSSASKIHHKNKRSSSLCHAKVTTKKFQKSLSTPCLKSVINPGSCSKSNNVKSSMHHRGENVMMADSSTAVGIGETFRPTVVEAGAAMTRTRSRSNSVDVKNFKPSSTIISSAKALVAVSPIKRNANKKTRSLQDIFRRNASRQKFLLFIQTCDELLKIEQYQHHRVKCIIESVIKYYFKEVYVTKEINKLHPLVYNRFIASFVQIISPNVMMYHHGKVLDVNKKFSSTPDVNHLDMVFLKVILRGGMQRSLNNSNHFHGNGDTSYNDNHGNLNLNATSSSSSANKQLITINSKSLSSAKNDTGKKTKQAVLFQQYFHFEITVIVTRL